MDIDCFLIVVNQLYNRNRDMAFEAFISFFNLRSRLLLSRRTTSGATHVSGISPMTPECLQQLRIVSAAFAFQAQRDHCIVCRKSTLKMSFFPSLSRSSASWNWKLGYRFLKAEKVSHPSVEFRRWYSKVRTESQRLKDEECGPFTSPIV